MTKDTGNDDFESVAVFDRDDDLVVLPAAVPAGASDFIGNLYRSEADNLASLGVIPAERPAITQLFLRDLHTYAQGRVAAGQASEALRLLEIDIPDLVGIYRLGYLPESYQDVLPKAARLALHGLRLSKSIVIPAYDDHGAVVDLLAIQVRKRCGTCISLASKPRGLIAPNVATAHQNIVVVDSVHTLGRLFAAGYSNVLLMRGPEDARYNASRLRTAGVRSAEVRVQRYAGDFASALEGIGITVSKTGCPQGQVGREPLEPVTESPMPSVSVTIDVPPLVLAEHDRQGERATFTAGQTTYVVQIPWDREAQQEVVVRHAGKVFIDQFHLASQAARQRAASNATLRCGLAAPVIEAHLQGLREAALALLDAGDTASTDSPALAPTGADYDDAIALLRSPDLLDRMAADLETLSWVGEEPMKRLLLLAAVSRKLPEPVWMALSASEGVGTSNALSLVAEVTPPEEVVQVSRLTGHALYYQDENALRHKLLVIDDADALPAEVVVALSLLQQRGVLSVQQVPRHNLSGSARTQTNEVRGPVAVVTATAGALDHQLLAHCCVVATDESPEHTARVLAAQRRMLALPGMGRSDPTRTAITRRHHHLHRLLASRPVVIPYAERIVFPAVTVQHRRDQDHFFGLIKASALLHQHQRLSDRGHVVADERDFQIAQGLAGAAGITDDADIGHHARTLLTALRAAQMTTFTMDDCVRLLPQWTRYAFRNALGDLMALDHVASGRGGQGRQRRYALVGEAAATSHGAIRLQPVGDLAKVGENNFTKFTPVTASG